MRTLALCIVSGFIMFVSFNAIHADDLKFDADRVATELLDDATDAARRDELVKQSISHAGPVIEAMTKDLPRDEKEEYRRIPWIWRVAIESSRRNDEGTLLKLLEISLPSDEQALDDWRAVVIGGGIINGVSQVGDWPAKRMRDLIEHSKSDELEARWQRTVKLAAKMVDNEKTPTGTRYDALRILGAADWKSHQALITKYLAADVHPELQMGAVSAAGDFEDDEAAQALIESLGGLTASNQNIAIDALLRGERHAALLNRAVSEGRVKREWLSNEQLKKLGK